MEYDSYEVDLSLYKLFYEVYKHGSFSKTADVLGVTQPSISYNIKRLEDYLGVKLFIRGNNLSLTPEGEVLVPYVEEALNSIKNGVNRIHDLVNLQSGEVSIGVPSHIGVFLLTDIIKKFNKSYPSIKMKVICKPTKELFYLLNSNELDVVIDSSPLNESFSNLILVRISKERCVFACNKSCKSLLNETVSLNDLTNYSLIVPNRGSGSTRGLMEVFEKKKIEFDPDFEISTSDMIAEMVENNLGVGYLFEKTLDSYPDLRVVDVDAKLPIFDIFMIYKDKLFSVTAKTFIDFVRDEMKK